MSGAASPQLSVVMPALGNHSVLARVLDGYERQAAAERFEVIVAADRAEPDPAAIERLLAGRPFAARMEAGTVAGASGARNAGWRAARAPLVLFTDSDTIPTPGLVAEHLAWHRRFPAEEVAVLGLVRWAPGIRVSPFMRWLEQGVQFDFQSIPGEEASWAHLYSSNCSLKRRFVERLGGYDEQRLPYGYEDLDLGYRGRELGLTVKFNRRAVVDHWREMTVAQWRARAPRLAVSEWRFCQLHPDVAPWFLRMFASAAAAPPGGRLAAALTRAVPRGTPWLGERVWRRAGLHWRQQIAPEFLRAWEAAVAGRPPELAPASSAQRERG